MEVQLVDLVIGRYRYSGLKVPANCAVGQWKDLLGQGYNGAKILYPQRLVCRRAAAGVPLPEEAQLPRPPERLHVSGPHTVVKMLELAIKDHLEVAKPKRPAEAAPPQRYRDAAGGQLPMLRPWSDAGADGKPRLVALQVQCPADAGPGSLLQVEDPRTGKAFVVTVPEFTIAGGSFEVRLPDAAPPTSWTPSAPRSGAATRAGAAAAAGAPAAAGGDDGQRVVVKGQPCAASVLAGGLDEEFVAQIRARHPEFRGEVPPEAAFWSETDLDAFCASDGLAWPCEQGGPTGSQTCALLRALRLHLAEQRVVDATAQYRSLCRHLETVGFERWVNTPRDMQSGRPPLGLTQLPALASSAAKVPRAASVTQDWSAPVVLESGTFPAIAAWDLDFWQRNYYDAPWTCRSRSPPCSDDSALGAEAVEVVARVGEYVEYARLLGVLDPACKAENAMANFRVQLEGWPAFREAMWGTFTGVWRDLVPPGLEDLTVRWVEMFADTFGSDWLETLSRYYTVSIAAPGCVTRLHRENHGAHLWLSQTEGRRLVHVFPPGEGKRLYERASSPGTGAAAFGRTASVSPVDLMAGATKRYPLLREAQAQSVVLHPGETLLLPSGWWWHSVALEPCASVQHRFYNRSNFQTMARDLEDTIENFGDGTRAALVRLREDIYEDNEDWNLRVQDE